MEFDLHHRPKKAPYTPPGEPAYLRFKALPAGMKAEALRWSGKHASSPVTKLRWVRQQWWRVTKRKDRQTGRSRNRLSQYGGYVSF